MKFALPFILFTCPVFSNVVQKEKFDVVLIAVKPFDPKTVSFRVDVTNRSDRTINVSKYTLVDFVWPKIKPMGNYIFEIKKRQNNEFTLFAPLNDIDPVYQPEEWLKLNDKTTMVDTISIGFYYGKKGFQPGEYRVRVFFNASRWSHDLKDSSNWISFTIIPDASN